MRHLKQPPLCPMGACKGTLHMPEQLTLKQRFRNGGAIKRHERAFTASAVRMNDASHHLFTGASLPEQ